MDVVYFFILLLVLIVAWCTELNVYTLGLPSDMLPKGVLLITNISQ